MTATHERLFFALWPDADVRREIARQYRQHAPQAGLGRAVKSANLHLTLHFLGNIPSSQIDCFIQHAQRVQHKPFEISLQNFGYFKKSKVLWMGCSAVSPALLELQQVLGTEIAHCGYRLEKRRFYPHVTLARKVDKAVTASRIPTIFWSVNEFVLVRSLTHSEGVEYQVRNRFRLQ